MFEEASSSSVYRKIAAELRVSILRGRFRPREKLPSVRDLAVSEGVNPTTIQNVYALLEQEGWIETVTGRGTFVRDPSALPLTQRRRHVRKLMERAYADALYLGITEAEWRELVNEVSRPKSVKK